MNILFIRHAHKTKNGQLSNEGKVMTKKFIHSNSFTMHSIYCSPIGRCKETAKLMKKWSKNKPTIIESKLLSEGLLNDQNIEKLNLSKGAWLLESASIEAKIELHRLKRKMIKFLSGSKSRNTICITHLPNMMVLLKIFGLKIKKNHPLQIDGKIIQPLEIIQVSSRKNKLIAKFRQHVCVIPNSLIS